MNAPTDDALEAMRVLVLPNLGPVGICPRSCARLGSYNRPLLRIA
jgi:hypothetical protein